MQSRRPHRRHGYRARRLELPIISGGRRLLLGPLAYPGDYAHTHCEGDDTTSLAKLWYGDSWLALAGAIGVENLGNLLASKGVAVECRFAFYCRRSANLVRHPSVLIVQLLNNFGSYGLTTQRFLNYVTLFAIDQIHAVGELKRIAGTAYFAQDTSGYIMRMRAVYLHVLAG